jgi:predicted transcriptional regulator
MRPIDRVLERLESLKTHNGYYKALCPAHDDGEPSLSVSEGEDARVLLKCFAGCSFGAVVEALGLDERDLFTDGEREGGDVYPSKTSATVQYPPEKPHRNAEKLLHTPDATPDNTATPPAPAQDAAGVTLEGYAEYVGLPAAYLKSLGLREIHYVDQKAVKMAYLDVAGDEICVRFRVSLTGKPKIKTRKGDKHRLYGLWSLGEMKERAGFVVLVEGESDCHVGWHHDVPVIGVPGAVGFQPEWAGDLDGFEKIYAIIEPDDAGETFWQRLAATPELRERLYRVDLKDAKDLRDLYKQDPDKFTERLQKALEGARHWMDIAESEALERSRKAWERCATLAGEESILERFYATLRDSGVAGERRTAMILYLALTSRQLDRPVSVAVKGPSSGGKSFLVERVTEYFPESAVYALTAMSEKTLAYSDEPIKHRFLILYEASGMGGDFQTYLIRSLLSEGRLRYETLEKTPEGIKPRLIEREGPTGLIVTTTMDRLHPENETRLLSLLVADTREQTKQVLRALADEDHRPPERDEWLALQEWLEGAVRRTTIPFAGVLADLVPPAAVRLRRDFSAVLNLIRAHALLHQTTREIDESGRVVATIEEDYRMVRELVADLVAEGVEATVSETVRETVEVIERLLDEGDEDALSLTQIAAELKLDKSAASRRVRSAANKGFVENSETRKGRPGRYLLGEPLPDDVVVLPEVEEVLQRCEPLHETVQHSDPHSNAGSGGTVAPLHSDPEGYTPSPSPDEDPGVRI